MTTIPKEKIVKIFNNAKIDNVNNGGLKKILEHELGSIQSGLNEGDRCVLYDILIEKYGEPEECSKFFVAFNVKNKDKTTKLFVDGMPDRGDFVRKISTENESINLNDFNSIDDVLNKIDKMVQKDSPDFELFETFKKQREEKESVVRERLAQLSAIEENARIELENNLEEIDVDINALRQISENIII